MDNKMIIAKLVLLFNTEQVTRRYSSKNRGKIERKWISQLSRDNSRVA